MFISKMTKKTLSDFEGIGWSPIYKKNNIVIITKHKPSCSKRCYLEDLIKPFKTLGNGLWNIISGITLTILFPVGIIKTLLDFIPTIFIIGDKNEEE